MHHRQEESRLRAVVDTAVDGVILIDAAGIILMFNPACEKLFGYAAFEVVGRNVKVLMPDPYQHEHDSYLSNYGKTGVRKIIGIGREVLGRKRSGATFPMDLSVGESSEDGRPIFVGIIRDLTERKASEAALRESASRLQALIDTAVDGVILIDATGLVQMFNPACEKLFGYAAHQVIGHNVKMLMPDSYAHEHDAYLANYHDTGERKIIGIGREVLGRRRDGTTFPMELSVGEAEQEGNSIFVGIIHDISARKATEQQLAQAQKMEIVGQLSGGIAHDFNNLLTVILGNAEALTLRLKDRKDLSGLSETIVGAAERGAELTQRLLAFSRRQVLQPTAVDCNALMENMRVLLRRMLREDVDLHLQLSPEPVFAMADSAQLESAVLNLTLNAQDAMPSGGALTLATSAVELDQFALGGNSDARPGSYVMVAITDTGIGMSPEVITRAFEPFFTTKEVGKGSGLGLSMVYGFVKQSNGHVTIYSEIGHGTTVRLFIPVTSAPGKAPAPRSLGAEETPRGSETLLVVEDDAFVRSHVIASLEQLGYHVMVAANGREALDMLNAGARPALLFTDVVMPGGINGWELVAEARRLMPELRVLYTSGYPQEALSGRATDPSATILTKPYRLAELAKRVREKLDR